MNAREVIQALEADGWTEVASKGAHRQFRHPTQKGRVTVAVHGGRDLDIRDIKSIEKQSGLTLRRR